MISPHDAFSCYIHHPAAPCSSLRSLKTREGLYKDYTVDVKEQAVDDAKGTYKTAKQTSKGKSKYIGVLGVLLIGSFIIPMMQYFW